MGIEKRTPNNLSDLSGQRFGKLVAEYPFYDGVRWRWHCTCDCGNAKDVIPADLKRGMVKSCGCYRKNFRKIDLSGKRFGYLTVVSVAEDDNKHHGQKWVCKCDCGNMVVVRGDGLKSGHTKSCGCTNKRRTTHGKSNTRLFKVWTSMKQRCQNENDSKYNDYGGRGIKVCEEWSDFDCFFLWSSNNGYKEGLTIDRINNDGDYAPGNCRWTTRKIQMSNRRNTIYLEYNGEKRSLSEWSDIVGVKRKTLDSRYRKGWTEERILFNPVKHYTNKKEVKKCR